MAQFHWMTASSYVVGMTLLSAASAADRFRFEEVVIDPAICDRACYAVVLADVDGDSRDDIVAVTETQVVWYQNPDWQKRTIIDQQTEPDNVCIAPHDIDGDGKVDFALGAGWTKVGTIQWLSRADSINEKWHVHSIGEEAWTHRMRWADVLGMGQPQLVVSPLNATKGNGVRLTAFVIPENPKADPWRRELLDDTLNRLHNHWHVDLDGNGSVDTLTASQEGVNLLTLGDDGQFNRVAITAGAEGGDPAASGTGEIKPGRLGNGEWYLATIEPMHGNMVVVYTLDGDSITQLAKRVVLDDTLKQGHGIFPANLDDDPADEIIVGHREMGDGPVKGPGISIFDSANVSGSRWVRHVIDDGGMACEDIVCGDVDGDGDIDIVAGGRATRNLKLYLNQRD